MIFIIIMFLQGIYIYFIRFDVLSTFYVTRYVDETSKYIYIYLYHGEFHVAYLIDTKDEDIQTD